MRFFLHIHTFLDVNVSLQDDSKIVTGLYTKPTDKHQYLLLCIRHVIPYMPGAIPFSNFSFYRLRLRRICSTNETFTLHANELIDYIYKCGYNRYFL